MIVDGCFSNVNYITVACLHDDIWEATFFFKIDSYNDDNDLGNE